MALLLDAITVRYGDRLAVDGLTLRVEDGEAVALLGPSGSGKTTILRVIAGLEEPDSGDVMFDRQRMNGVPPARRDLGMVFQENVLFPKMNVGQNVGFPLRVRRVPAAEVAARVEAEARATGISRLVMRDPRRLSAGQQQVVQLARAMVRRPSVLLVDEPFARLDPIGTDRLRSELRLVQEGYGVTAVYATHDHADATALADRVAVIETGRVRQVGTPLELYRDPADVSVATLIGDPVMDILASEPAPGGVSVGGMFLPIAARLPSAALVGVRPEAWRVGRRGLEAVVVRTYLHGSDTFAVVDSPAGRLTFRSSELVDVGDRVRLHPAHFHVFDEGSGRALFHSA